MTNNLSHKGKKGHRAPFPTNLLSYLSKYKSGGHEISAISNIAAGVPRPKISQSKTKGMYNWWLLQHWRLDSCRNPFVVREDGGICTCGIQHCANMHLSSLDTGMLRSSTTKMQKQLQNPAFTICLWFSSMVTLTFDLQLAMLCCSYLLLWMRYHTMPWIVSLLKQGAQINNIVAQGPFNIIWQIMCITYDKFTSLYHSLSFGSISVVVWFQFKSGLQK